MSIRFKVTSAFYFQIKRESIVQSPVVCRPRPSTETVGKMYHLHSELYRQDEDRRGVITFPHSLNASLRINKVLSWTFTTYIKIEYKREKDFTFITNSRWSVLKFGNVLKCLFLSFVRRTLTGIDHRFFFFFSILYMGNQTTCGRVDFKNDIFLSSYL